jgi:hypothetical protein
LSLQVLRTIRAPGTDISTELEQMCAAADRTTSLGGRSERMKALVADHKPELLASVLYPLVLMLSGLNVLSTWLPNLLISLGADPGFALRSNTLMMAVGLVAALPGM